MDNPTTSFEKQIAQHVATLTFQHLTRSNLVREPQDDAPLLWVWRKADRVVLIVNPLRIKNVDALTRQRFTHHLSTVLQGRRIVVTNHRGIFVQVGYYPETKLELQSRALDLLEQRSPLHVPIGMTERGPLWLSLSELDAVLIGGARRMGKTNLLHTWIAALLQGGQVRLILFDGKGGVEFERYAQRERCQVVNDALAPVLRELYAEMQERFEILKQARVANLADYNSATGNAGARLERIVLMVDELAYALQEDAVEDVLVDLTARGGAVGIHPVLATQRPSSDLVTPRLKGNLVTRIALAVPDRASSFVVLDRAGAEAIVKVPGRLLMLHGARLIEAQAFQVSSEKAKGKSEDAPMLASPRLSDRERRLAQAAIERDGWFRVKEVASTAGESNRFALGVAQKWELLGWLTPAQRDARGMNLGRRVTEALLSQVHPVDLVDV